MRRTGRITQIVLGLLGRVMARQGSGARVLVMERDGRIVDEAP
jgi:hypothetical protein